MSHPAEQAPGLLHNTGCAPRASILWRGIGRGPLADDAERIEEIARMLGGLDLTDESLAHARKMVSSAQN